MLTLEPFMFTLGLWSLTLEHCRFKLDIMAHPEALETHSGVVEAHPGTVEAYYKP